MDFSIPTELLQIQQTVRRYIERHLAPLEEQVDREDSIDPDTMQALRAHSVEAGIYGFNIPEEYGGAGVGPIGEALIGEEVGRTSIALAEAVGRIPRALLHCDASQRSWLLEPALRAEKTACVALTETEAGSDLMGVRTRAVMDGDAWRISGNKQFISHAETADVILALAVTDPSASLSDRFTVFALDRTTPGLHITHRYRKLGWHGYHISAFSLDDCVVDDGRVLGEVGAGFKVIMDSVNSTRLFIAARCVGSARYLIEMAVEYASNRRTFGQRLGDHQAIQFMLADMDVETQAAHLLVMAAAAHAEQGTGDFRIAASRAKLYASEVACRVADSALQIFGGAGFMADLPVERMYRDLRGYRIGEGSSEMQRIQIARHLLARR